MSHYQRVEEAKKKLDPVEYHKVRVVYAMLQCCYIHTKHPTILSATLISFTAKSTSRIEDKRGRGILDFVLWFDDAI